MTRKRHVVLGRPVSPYRPLFSGSMHYKRRIDKNANALLQMQ